MSERMAAKSKPVTKEKTDALKKEHGKLTKEATRLQVEAKDILLEAGRIHDRIGRQEKRFAARRLERDASRLQSRAAEIQDELDRRDRNAALEASQKTALDELGDDQLSVALRALEDNSIPAAEQAIAAHRMRTPLSLDRKREMADLDSELSALKGQAAEIRGELTRREKAREAAERKRREEEFAKLLDSAKRELIPEFKAMLTIQGKRWRNLERVEDIHAQDAKLNAEQAKHHTRVMEYLTAFAREYANSDSIAALKGTPEGRTIRELLNAEGDALAIKPCTMSLRIGWDGVGRKLGKLASRIGLSTRLSRDW